MVSIIVPIYKVELYVERCLDSIIEQEHDEIDIECILVNDCTPDESMRIVNDRLKRYSGKIQFVILNHQENMGLSAARNTGINHAHGDFVFFVDSDDRLEPGALRCLVNGYRKVMVDHPDIDVVMGNTLLCKNGKPAIDFEESIPLLIDNAKEEGLRQLLTRKLFHTAWNKLVRRDFLLEHRVYFEKGIIDEDLLWSYLIFLYARKIYVMPQLTYVYENNPGSIMNTSAEKVAHIIRSRITTCNIILNTPPRQSFVEYNMYVFFILTRAVNLYEQNRSNESVKLMGEDLGKLRDRFLQIVLNKKLFLQYLFFLTSKKPLYYINKCRLYRRYYDKVANFVMRVSK